MARRDVDLVIKAKDEAAAVVDSITRALNQFIDAQKGLDSRAADTQSTLQALGSAIGNLDKSLKGLSAGDKLTAELATAEGALARLEDRMAKTEAEARQLDTQLKQNGLQLESYKSKLSGAVAAQERQAEVVKRAKSDQKELTSAYDKAVAAQERYQNRQKLLPQLIENATAANTKAIARFDELKTKIAETAAPTKTLQDRLEASGRSVQKTGDRLAKLRDEFATVNSRLKESGNTLQVFGQQADRATANVARQEQVLSKIETNLNGLKQSSAATARQQGQLSSAFAKVNGSLERQSQTISKAENDYVTLATAAGRADRALADLVNSGVAALEGQFKAQRKAVLQAKAAYVEATQAATQLGAQMARTSKPSTDLVVAFEQARSASRSLKDQLLQQRVAYEQLGGSLRGTTADIESVRATQQQFSQVQTTLAQNLKRTQQAAAQEQAEIARLHGASTQAAGSAGRLRGETDRLASSNRKAAGETGRLASAYKQFYGDTRKSLSFLQRIRGEVLSLVAAYGGLYASINILHQTVDATQQLEAAQSRLNVAFNGDKIRVGQELDFVRRTADRLGLSFGTLATEYSKFNIAAQNTKIQGRAARDIFVSVAEAARVNRSSTKDLEGVFVALTQIVSKGAVQMEELRQQLGDRLPGAVQLMADALGIGTAQLFKMLQQGQVTEAALIPFAEELKKRFGGGLEDSLSSVTVALGRLGNAAFQALLRFGKAGFLKGFQNLVRDLTDTLNSADFQTFADNASAAFGQLAEFLGFLAKNFRLVVAAASGFIALRLTPIITAMISSLGALTVSTTRAGVSFTVLQARAAAMGVTVTRVGFAVRGMTRALRVLLSSTGVGLAITAIAAGIGYWSSQADLATAAMERHRKIVDIVKNAYDKADGSVENWRKNVEGLSVTEARKNVDDLKNALLSTVKELDTANQQGGGSFKTRFFGYNLGAGASEPYRREVNALIDDLTKGKVTFADFRGELDKISEKYRDGSAANKRYAAALDGAAVKVQEAAVAYQQGRDVLTAMTGTTEQATGALDRLNGVAATTGQAFDVEKAAKFEKAIENLDTITQKASKDTEYLAQVVQIDNAFSDAIDNAQTLEDRIRAAISQGEALTAVTQKFVDAKFGGFTDSVDAAAALIRQTEGFQQTAKFDVNAFRAGYGSDTVTLADGSIQKVVQGMTVTVADANRDLIRRITTEFQPIAKAAAGGRFEVFTPQQQAALTSLAYNYGEIPDKVASVLKTGTAKEIAGAIRSLAGDNGGVNRNRRFQEAALFDSSAAIQTQQTQAEKALATQKEQAQATQDTISGNNVEIHQQQLINDGKDRQVAIEKAVLAAKKENPQITQEEIDKITEQTGKLYDLKQAEKDRKTEIEKAKDAEARVNQLLTVQQNLREQMNIAIAQGDLGAAKGIQDSIKGVNDQLLQAIDNAIAMWKAIGGEEAQAAIVALETARARAQEVAQAGDDTYLKWNRLPDLFVSGLTGAFEQFAKAIAEGQNRTEALRNAFLKFASDFLLEIAKMIIQQAIFNALTAAFGGTSFGNLLGLKAPTAHTGGLVGSSSVGSGNGMRTINPAVFAFAMRYHSGGIAGLQPNEVPTILKKGEEVLTKGDPRHMLNQAAQTAGKGGGDLPTIINAFDGSDALEQALSAPAGGKVFFNFVRRHKNEVKQILGG